MSKRYGYLLVLLITTLLVFVGCASIATTMHTSDDDKVVLGTPTEILSGIQTALPPAMPYRNLFESQDDWTMYTNANYINDLTFAPDGALWVATLGGVVKWDVSNKAYVKYFVDNSPISSAVTAIAAAKNGVIWVGTEDGMIASFDGNDWQVHEFPELYESMEICEIFEDSQGRVWFATFGAGAIVYEDDTWQVYLQKDGLASVAVVSVDEDSDGRIWLGTTIPCCDSLDPKNVQSSLSPGLSRLDGDTWTVISKEIGFDEPVFGGVADLLADSEGLWIARWFEKLVYYDGESIKQYSDSPSLSRDLQLDRQGHLWGVAQGSVFEFDGVDWALYTQQEGLSAEALAMTIAPDNSIWVGTRRGVFHFHDQVWEIFSTTEVRDSLPMNRVWDVAFTTEGAVWLATDHGPVFFDGTRWRTFSKKSGLPGYDVRNIQVASDGTVWISSLSGIEDTVLSYDGNEWVSHDYGEIGWFLGFMPDGTFWDWSYKVDSLRYYDHTDTRLYPGQVFSTPEKLIVTADSDIWVFEGSGELYRFNTDEQLWELLDSTDIYFRGIALAPDGNIWVRDNDNRIYAWGSDGSWEYQTTFEGDTGVRDMALGNDGTLWVIQWGTGEIWKFKGDEWTEVPVPDVSFWSIFPAPDGAIWLMTQAGVLRYK